MWTASASLHVLAGCAVLVMARYASPVLLPVVLAVMLFYMLDPLVDWIERRRVPRLLASLVVVGALLGGVLAGVVGIWPQIDAVLTKVPDGAARLAATLRRQQRVQGDSALERVQAAADAIDSAAAAAETRPTRRPGVVAVEVQEAWRPSNLLWTGGLGVLGISGQGLTVLFLTLFLLVENDSFKRRLVARLDRPGDKRLTVQILNDIARQMERFIWVQVLTSSVVGAVTTLALWGLGVEEPLVWGVSAGLLNVVPYFGALIVTGALATVAYLQFGTLEQTALVAGVTLAITTAEGMVLTPHLLSRAASLNQVAIFLTIVFWSWAWGVPGMLLAVPILMAVKAVCDHIESLKPVGDFLSR